MTTILATRKNEKIFMGSDSAVYSDRDLTAVNINKIFQIENYLFGSCGLTAPKKYIQIELSKYKDKFISNKLDDDFCFSVIENTIKNYKFEYIEKDCLFELLIFGKKNSYIFTYIYNYSGSNKTIGTFQETDSDFFAIGAGKFISQAVYSTLNEYNVEITEEDKIKISIEKSKEYCNLSGGKVTILSI